MSNDLKAEIIARTIMKNNLVSEVAAKFLKNKDLFNSIDSGVILWSEAHTLMIGGGLPIMAGIAIIIKHFMEKTNTDKSVDEVLVDIKNLIETLNEEE